MKLSDLPKKIQDKVKKQYPDLKKKKKPRYSSIKPKIDGHTFDSKVEGDIYWEYRLDPEVKVIDVHPRYMITPKIVRGDQVLRALYYEPDLMIEDARGRTIVEVKGLHLLKDPKYMRNRSLFLLRYQHLNFLEIITDSCGNRREVFYPAAEPQQKETNDKTD